MKDRNVQFPQRYRIQKVNGTDDVFDLIPAPGEVSDDGTFLNKATLLKDVTASLFGLGADAVPDDVLAFLGKYNQHWWKRRVVTALYGYGEKQTQAAKNTPNLYKQQDSVIQYADSIAIDQTTGAISLINPQSVSVSQAVMKTSAQVKAVTDLLHGKYVTGLSERNDDGNYYPTSTVYYVPSGTKWDKNYSNDLGYYYSVYPYGNGGYYINLVGSELFYKEPGAVDYVFAYDRNTYPDSGESDGYEWKYLGVPFDNAVTAPKIVTGSYVGTGTYGSGNPSSLTFDFVPKYLIFEPYLNKNGVLLVGNSSYYAIYVATDAIGVTSYTQVGANAYVALKKSADGKTITWYGTEAQYQKNVSGCTYYYLAIG